MTTTKKSIESLGLSDTDARNALEVTYKKNYFVFYTDAAGLDFFDFNEDSKEMNSIGHELFCKVVDTYRSLGLLKALIEAGAVIKPAKKSRGYFLYKIQGHKELWKGAIEKEFSYRAGYVFEMANLDQAIDAAEEEMRCMMAECN
jgi:hypothetical protein